jgi:hypothetical protein
MENKMTWKDAFKTSISVLIKDIKTKDSKGRHNFIYVFSLVCILAGLGICLGCDMAWDLLNQGSLGHADAGDPGEQLSSWTSPLGWYSRGLAFFACAVGLIGGRWYGLLDKEDPAGQPGQDQVQLAR